MNCRMPGFPVLNYLLECVQTHVHWASDAIQPSHFLLPSYPQSFPALGFFPVSQLFVSGSNRIGVSVLAPFLSMNIQGWFPLWLTDLITLLSKGLSRVFFSNTVQKHELFGDQPSLWSNSHNHTLTTEKQHSSDTQIFVGKVMSLLLIPCLDLS